VNAVVLVRVSVFVHLNEAIGWV